jgi:hypothetical protein
LSSWRLVNYALEQQEETVRGNYSYSIFRFSDITAKGGHIKPDVYNLCGSMAKKHGIEAAAEIAEFELANMEAVKNYVQENNVDCDLILTQAVDVQLSKEHDSALKAGFDKLKDAGVSATNKAFYIDGKYAEQVSIATQLLSMNQDIF